LAGGARMKSFLIGASVLTALVAGPSPMANASTIVYSNLGPGGTFNPSSGLSVSDSFGFVFSEATEFFPSGDYLLESISVALRSGLSEFDAISVSLVQGNDPLTGTLLESFALNDVTTSPQLYTLSSVVHPQLLGGQQYWLMISPADTTAESTSITWLENVIFAGEPTVSTLTYLNGVLINSHFYQPAFEVKGVDTAIPEPTTIVLLGSGIAAFAARRYRWRRPE
jgi:PEP-CTERM motif-containing protein